MVTVLVDSRKLTILPAYLRDLASEHLGTELIATTKSEYLTEFAFHGTDAQSNARAFRLVLDTCFAAPDPGTVI